MSPLDDPALALIARFVVDDIDRLTVSDENFLRHQIMEIQHLIENVPAEQCQDVILAWIQDHAENYRNGWQKKTYARALMKKRCSDCPLLQQGTAINCEIHQHWAALLKLYLAGDIPTQNYVRETLRLLQKHKDRLKVSRLSSRLGRS